MIHSAGIIPFRMNGRGKMEFFVGHPGGSRRNYWAFMKGQVEDGESTPDAALREFIEESGVDMNKCPSGLLIPLGSVMQNPKKKVTAYGLHFPDIDPSECYSNLTGDGVTPEIDRYRWMTNAELSEVTHTTHMVFYDKLVEMGNGG